MLNKYIFSVFLAILLTGGGAFSQTPTNLSTRAVIEIFPVGDLREGMVGVARTVFRGSKSEEFGVEILGVVPNWIGPKQDMIIGRLRGGSADRTSVFAGMSGSPVYIDGKLVGAISYSFPFAKEPICGITPFAQMTSVVEPFSASRNIASSRTFSLTDLRSGIWRPAISTLNVSSMASGFSADSRLAAIAGQTFRPISTPISITGLSQRTIDLFAPELTGAGFLPVAASAVGGDTAVLKMATETTLLGGDSVVVHLSRGDVSIAASGTVTLRDGEKIYAFGHPFFGLGSVDLPMSESHVVTVVPNSNNSFKLAVPDATVGAMTQDRATTIFGKLGQSAKMLPIRVKVATSRGRNEEINFETAFDELLTPIIVNAGVANALQASERALGDTTVEVDGEITIRGHDPLIIKRRFVGNQASPLAASVAAVPLSALIRANFPGAEITGVNLNLRSIDGSRTAVIDRISADRTGVRAGESLDISVFVRTESGQVNVERVALTIPHDAAPGPLTVTVGDGNAVQQGTAVTQFTPRSAAEFIATYNRLKRPDRLYAVLTRTSAGAVIGVNEMPSLPPSMMATLNNERTAGGVRPTINSILREVELPAGEYVIAGSHSLTIEVVK